MRMRTFFMCTCFCCCHAVWRDQEFTDAHLPGIYSKVVDDLVARGKKANLRAGQKIVVDRLTAYSQKIGVTLLACYSDGTCDVEVTKDFLDKWKKEPTRRFVLPGQLMKDGMKKPAEARAVLKKVPQNYLRAVYGAGFNIYDSLYKTTDDVLKNPVPRNDFDPRQAAAAKDPYVADPRAPYLLAAGPMPPDASPASCEYEWSVRMRAANEYEMHHFVAMLRRCVRLDNYQQASKMIEYQTRQAADFPELLRQANLRPMIGGQLDILLVEARRLKPEYSLLNRPEWKLNHDYLPDLNGTTDGSTAVGTPIGNTFTNCYVNFRMYSTKHDQTGKLTSKIVEYKGQKLQTSSVVHGTDSPNWSRASELQKNGGHVFHTGSIDPGRLENLLLDFEVMMAPEVGPMTVLPAKVGAISVRATDRMYMTNPNDPLKNLWLPLKSSQARKLEPGAKVVTKGEGYEGRIVEKEGNKWLVALDEGGEKVAYEEKMLQSTDMADNVTGELHIMTRWLPSDKVPIGPQGNKHLVSVRQTFLRDIWPKACMQRLREPIYNLEVKYLYYNPNLVRSGKVPEAPKDHQRRHAEELFNAMAYLECIENRQVKAWDKFDNSLDAKNLSIKSGVRLGEMRLKLVEEDDEAKLREFQDLVLSGIPSSRRMKYWLDLTMASRVMEKEGVNRQGQGAAPSRTAAQSEYENYLSKGKPMRSDAMLQLQEDALHMAGWETASPVNPELYDMHLKRVNQAQNVCTALIAVPSALDGGIVYCESLLIIAFYMMLPQGCKEEESPGDGRLFYLTENHVFWMLYTLICSRVNGTYKEYFGSAQQGVGAIGTCTGAVADINLLECALAYHEPEVWMRLNSVGFQLATVFYPCFMRLYASYLPTSSLFRLWDAIFSQSTAPHDLPESKPHARAYLIDLAFGVLKTKKDELLAVQSAQEASDLILGVLGAMYDMGTVSDLIQMSHSFLWGGSGFTSSRIADNWRQREDSFHFLNVLFAKQNEVLMDLTHKDDMKTIPATQYKPPMNQKGVTTKDLAAIYLALNNKLREDASRKKAGGGQNAKSPWKLAADYEKKEPWFMHRPMPKANKMLVDGTIGQAWKTLSRALTVAKPLLQNQPFLVGPLENQERGSKTGQGKIAVTGLEPLGFDSTMFTSAIQRDIPAWMARSAMLWQSFSTKGSGYLRGDYSTLSPMEMEDSGIHKMSLDCASMVMGQKSEGIDPEVETVTGDGHVSMNEIFVSLVACSRSTVGEKAAALFDMFATTDHEQKPTPHRVPVSAAAKSHVKNADANSLADGNSPPPADRDSQEARQNVLRFTIRSEYHEQKAKKQRGGKVEPLGEVYIPSLGPYFTYGVGAVPETHKFNIWGKPDEEVAKTKSKSAGGGAEQAAAITKHYHCIGDLECSITFTPKTIRNPESGQIMVHIKAIKFHQIFVSDYFKMNPFVEVNTFKLDANGLLQPEPISRYDPRGFFANDHQHSYLTTFGAYGDTMKWTKTMRDAFLSSKGDAFHHNFRAAEGMGFEPNQEKWCWNDNWGKQYSVENFTFHKDFIVVSTRRNVMELQVCRLFTQTLFHRSLWNFTNRQAILMADAIYNRSGVVPGFLEAILVSRSDYENFAAAKASAGVDVLKEIVLEHEKQMADNGGYLNLFRKEYMEFRGSPINIKKDMGIDARLSFSGKAIWLRYVRGGDGERCKAVINVNASGDVEPNQEIELEQRDIWPQTKISKEEFVACTLASPLISEAIRRLASSAPESTKKSIALDVSIMDPHKEEEDKEIMGQMAVGQSILVEVWDSDIMGKDFLGEAWLPPLETFGSRWKDLVLPLTKADDSPDGEHGVSRDASSKQVGDEELDPNKKITGEIYLSVCWAYPAYEMKSEEQEQMELDGMENKINDSKTPPKERQALMDKVKVIKKERISREDLSHRAEVQKFVHAGRLGLKVKQAKNLRRSDARKGRECDPMVQIYMRNDVFEDGKGRWRKKPIARTSTIQNNRNPVWKEDALTLAKEMLPPDPRALPREFSLRKDLVAGIDVLTGAYEEQLPDNEETFLTNMRHSLLSHEQETRRELNNELDAVRIFGKSGLKLKFAVDPKQSSSQAQPVQGENHKIEVFHGDSIFEFKDKINLACKSEALFWEQRKGQASAEFNQYTDVEMGLKTIVMVFVPSAEVVRLANEGFTTGKAYAQAYEQAQMDPSNWQPLDPARTFAQYPQFGFGQNRDGAAIPQQLRILEATPFYKTQNLRYKKFEEERSKPNYQDKDDMKEAFGWARYYHSTDVLEKLAVDGKETSCEWRPCYASKAPKNEGGNGQMYGVKWCIANAKPTAPEGKETAKDKKKKDASTEQEEKVDEVAEKQWVLLKPRTPLFDDNTHPGHVRALEQALVWRRAGKNDFEIAAILNQILEDTPESEKPATEGKIPPVTVDVVKSYLQMMELKNIATA